ncbi:MAG: cobalamin biosynthesis protein [Desulfovibrionaceae bacterium]|nr:cobalamin biosynthesis protein [Desulfovibrionaceae bacterium]
MHKVPDTLACWCFSPKTLGLAIKLKEIIGQHPWTNPQGALIYKCESFAPERFAPLDFSSFCNLKATFSYHYPRFAGHLFIGALAIAVRLLAPHLEHKFQDRPCVVLEGTGKYVISLLSGHLGGANALTRHLANFLKATPIITTLSDSLGKEALDLLLQKADLKILDAKLLPQFQALFLEDIALKVFDPYKALPPTHNLVRVDSINLIDQEKDLHLTIDYLKIKANPKRLRVVLPRLFMGLGFKKKVSFELLNLALEESIKSLNLETLALRALASIDPKTYDQNLILLAKTWKLPLYSFSAKELAAISTPNPSLKAGQVFGQKPFSVAESSALKAALKFYPQANLIYPKVCFEHEVTLAIALGVNSND